MLRRVRVRTVDALSPGLVRVTLNGEQLGAFTTATGDNVPEVRSPFFDDVVVFCLPDPDTARSLFRSPGPAAAWHTLPDNLH